MMRGGRNYNYSPPAFSNDAKKLLICSGNTVSVFSTSTGLQITELEGHTALVTSVIVVPASTPASKMLCYCWTASVDGTIRYWDFSTPELMKTVDIGFPIFSMVIPGLYRQPLESCEKSPDLFAYVSVQEVKGKILESEGQEESQEAQPNISRGQIRKWNLTKSRLAGGIILAETPRPEFITISSDGKFCGIRDKRKIRIWHIPAKDSDRVVFKRMRFHHTKNFTTLVFHPTERIVAAGDVTGRILIWRDFGKKTLSTDNNLRSVGLENEDERPGVRDEDDADSCTTWHWHSHEVRVLFFSSDGAYLYSGGKEGVLVVWQLDTGKKKFLPRIGSPIMYYISSPDPSISSISCADNRVHILKMPSMEILKSIYGIKPPYSPPQKYTKSCNGVVFDHTAGLVAICTENYRVQLYSLFDDREVTEVQICERNHQPNDEVTVIMSIVAISMDGSMMGTVETKLPEEGIGGLISLKFWTSESQSKDFSLSTVIYEPHRDEVVSAIAFHPTRQVAVSASYGGEFKIWVCNHEIRQDQMLQNTGWKCHAVGSYKKRPMTAAVFSMDGSVLAVAAEIVVTLWDPDRNILLAVIGESLEPIVALSFVGKSNYLVTASRGTSAQLSLWSMSELALSWSYKLQTEAVACTMDGSSFAVLALLPESFECLDFMWGTDGAIIVFKAGDPIPSATWFVNRARGGGLGFLSTNQASSKENVTDGKSAKSLLAYINGNHEYVVFDPFGEQADEQIITHREGRVGIEETAQFGYASVYGELPEFTLKKNENSSVAAVVPSEKPWDTLFSGSSHSLPPLTKLCSVFLESLLERRTSVVE